MLDVASTACGAAAPGVLTLRGHHATHVMGPSCASMASSRSPAARVWRVWERVWERVLRVRVRAGAGTVRVREHTSPRALPRARPPRNPRRPMHQR